MSYGNISGYRQWNGRYVPVKRWKPRYPKYKRRNYGYRSKKKKSYGITAKLLDKKINTAYEVAAKRIAQEEIAKNRVSLVKRDYIFGDYVPASNEYVDGVSIDFLGKIVYISDIDLIDNVTSVNVPKPDDPLTMDNEALDLDGVNQIAPTQNPNGRRNNNTVIFTGVSLELRGKIERLLDADPMTYDNVKLQYEIIQEIPNVYNTPYVIPTVQQLMAWRGFGYTPKIDADAEELIRTAKRKTLLKGTMMLNLSEGNTDIKFDKTYVKFKRPIKIQYALGDQNGTDPILGGRIFLCIRSTVPNSAHSKHKPIVHCATKLYYYEP